MKKTQIMLSLILILCFVFVSCNVDNIDTSTNTDTSSNTDTNTSCNTNTDMSTNTDTSADTDTGTNTDTGIDKVEPEKPVPLKVATFKSTQPNIYYSAVKSIINSYTKDFPMYKSGDWYKIVRSYEELLQIDEDTDIDENIFEESCILIVHRYYNREKYFGYYIGYKDAKQTDMGFEITVDCYPSEWDWTSQLTYTESVEYLAVPRAELESVSCFEGELILTLNERAFVGRASYSISEEKAKNLENGTVWMLKSSKEYTDLINEYNIKYQHGPSDDSVVLAIYLDENQSIGIGHTFSVEENEINIVIETFANAVMPPPYPDYGHKIYIFHIERALLTNENLDEYNYNIFVLENITQIQ